MDKTSVEYRKKRVKRIKKIIVGTCIFLLLFPTVLSIILMIKVSHLQSRLDQYEHGEVQQVKTGVENTEKPSNKPEATATSQPKPAEKKVYLTFDDGPGIESDKILDALKKEGVKATFFVNGKEDEFSIKVYKRIVQEGHTLGMHSYSHLYDDIYSSKEAFREDTKKEYELIHKITGIYPKFYRFPGGSSSSKIQLPLKDLTDVLDEFKLTYVDWNIISADSVNTLAEASEISKGIVESAKQFDESVVLMYDVATRPNTVKALPEIIRTLKAQNYIFEPISENTKVIRHNE